MPVKSTTPVIRLTSAIGAFAIVTIVISVIWYLIVQEVLMKLSSLSIVVRQGYDNPFLSMLALSGVLLLVAFIFYGIITVMLSKSTISMWPRVLIGMITGVLAVIILQLSTVGLPLSDPAMLAELAIMALGGGLLPITQNVISRSIIRKEL